MNEENTNQGSGDQSSGNDSQSQPQGGTAPLMSLLRGETFPMHKDDIVRLAEQLNDENVSRMVEQLPDREFQSITEITEAVGSQSQSQMKSSGTE